MTAQKYNGAVEYLIDKGVLPEDAQRLVEIFKKKYCKLYLDKECWEDELIRGYQGQFKNDREFVQTYIDNLVNLEPWYICVDYKATVPYFFEHHDVIKVRLRARAIHYFIG